MDLTDKLQKRIGTLTSVDHRRAFETVLKHILQAERHFFRGEAGGDTSAFVDAIHRVNQAFEAGLKATYCVFNSSNHDHVRLHDIEAFLRKSGLLNTRVLSQIETYRKEWRNPSVHDGTSRFTGQEVILAITSVAALALVFVEQVAAKNAFDLARDGVSRPLAFDDAIPLCDRIAHALTLFRCGTSPVSPYASRAAPPHNLIASAAGFLSAAISDVKVSTDVQIGPEFTDRVDMLVQSSECRVVVEVRRDVLSLYDMRKIFSSSKFRRYAQLTQAKGLVLYVHAHDVAMACEVTMHAGERYAIVCPAKYGMPDTSLAL